MANKLDDMVELEGYGTTTLPTAVSDPPLASVAPMAIPAQESSAGHSISFRDLGYAVSVKGEEGVKKRIW